MDANDITKILDNFQPAYNAAQEAARKSLEDQGFDWDDRSENSEPVHYYRGIGDDIREAINDLTGDVSQEYDTLLGLLFGDMLSGIDWTAVGEHYYEDAANPS